jgi:hypothetical protein
VFPFLAAQRNLHEQGDVVLMQFLLRRVRDWPEAAFSGLFLQSLEF